MRWSLLLLLASFILAAPCRGEVVVETVAYTHDDVELTGTLAWDDAKKGRRPGVLVVHEWWGLDDYARGRARQLAELGYVAFALDMYGTGRLTEHPSEAAQWSSAIRQNVDNWRARAEAGLAILRANDQVDTDRLAAIGYCFGGATVLQLAYAGSGLNGVVSFHGALPAADPAQAGQIDAKILICHGADDGFVPEAQIDAFREPLDEVDADYQIIYYAGATHSFTNPGADDRGIDALRYNPSADRRSWQHMQMFFDEIFTSAP